MKYKAIFERNADRLVNANTIYEGQVIVLPACMESSTVSVTKVPPLMVSAVPDLMPFWLVESVSSVSVCSCCRGSLMCSVFTLALPSPVVMEKSPASIWIYALALMPSPSACAANVPPAI